MANNSNFINERTDRWIDERLASLRPDNTWEPNVTTGLAQLRSRRGGRTRQRTRAWVLAAASVACLFALALPESRVLASRCVDCSVALWQGLATSRQVRAANLLPINDRKAVADFTLKDVSGNPIQLSALKGKVVLLNFWATWCGGCQVEIPWFIEFDAKYQASGLAVLGISMDDDGWKSVKPYVRIKHVNYTIVIGNGEMRKLYGLDAMPMTLMIDRAGRVAATHVGLVSKADYAAEIETLLTE